MSEALPRYLPSNETAEAISEIGPQAVLLPNPPGIFPPCDITVLGPRVTVLDQGVAAVFVDMDGTTTMTEDLCLDALACAVRGMTGWAGADWAGLDPEADYPHIIGHSTTRNIEYLVSKHGSRFAPGSAVGAFVEAVRWTLEAQPNPERVEECRETARVLGLLPFLERGEPRAWAPDMAAFGPGHWVRVGMEIYYRRLFGHFEAIRNGEGRAVAETLYGPGHTRPISPLPGLGVLHAIVKGWLGEDAAALADHLDPQVTEETRTGLGRLGAWFARNPAPIALVTASGAYETRVVLPEVFAGLRDEAARWPVADQVRSRVLEGFRSPDAFYDAIVTASDCHELRLKPHRDLYTVALHRLGLEDQDGPRVVGFEDTEAGIVALRAAGVGLACAVPFEGTRSHNFQAASHVAIGGLPEVLLQHRLFLPDSLLTPTP